MNFLATLLQTIAFVPALVRGIESLFSHRTGTEKKAAALSFLQAALSTDSAAAIHRSLIEKSSRRGWAK
jgi:hypothetical protein